MLFPDRPTTKLHLRPCTIAVRCLAPPLQLSCHKPTKSQTKFPRCFSAATCLLLGKLRGVRRPSPELYRVHIASFEIRFSIPPSCQSRADSGHAVEFNLGCATVHGNVCGHCGQLATGITVSVLLWRLGGNGIGALSGQDR